MEQQQLQVQEQSQKLLTSWQRNKLIKLFDNEGHTKEKSNEGDQLKGKMKVMNIFDFQKKSKQRLWYHVNTNVFLYVLNCVDHYT